MIELPDFVDYGYRVERELGANRAGGRVTYLATQLTHNRPVVIKQFQFAKTGSGWSDYAAYEREIQVLQGLNHRGIPCYLDSFQTDSGFCMIQEYKQATALSVTRSFSPETLRHIAVSVLEILIYLQDRVPPIIHRDIKPGNILVDDQFNVFLIDFGFARVGDGDVGVSSVVKGTLGFMPPEQLFNRKLTTSSDLYGLGMTLICLLTQTKADEIGNLVDISYQVKFKHLVPKLGQPWLRWLEKMVETRDKDRFRDAQTALHSMPTTPIHPPEIHLTQSEIVLTARRLGQVLTHSFEISNPVPETILEGSWEIETSPQENADPSPEHPWIRIDPPTFCSNQVRCCITVDTQRLIAETCYSRKLWLHTNAFPKKQGITLQVQTAPLPIQATHRSWSPLAALFLFVLISGRILFGLALPMQGALALPQAGFGLAMGSTIGLQSATWTLALAGVTTGTRVGKLAAAVVGTSTFVAAWFLLETLMGSWRDVFSGLIPGLLWGWLVGLGMGISVEQLMVQRLTNSGAIALTLLSAIFASLLSLGLILGFDGWITALAAIAGILLGSCLLNAPLNYAKRVAEFRRTERDRILP